MNEITNLFQNAFAVFSVLMIVFIVFCLGIIAVVDTVVVVKKICKHVIKNRALKTFYELECHVKSCEWLKSVRVDQDRVQLIANFSDDEEFRLYLNSDYKLCFRIMKERFIVSKSAKSVATGQLLINVEMLKKLLENIEFSHVTCEMIKRYAVVCGMETKEVVHCIRPFRMYNEIEGSPIESFIFFGNSNDRVCVFDALLFDSYFTKKHICFEGMGVNKETSTFRRKISNESELIILLRDMNVTLRKDVLHQIRFDVPIGFSLESLEHDNRGNSLSKKLGI